LHIVWLRAKETEISATLWVLWFGKTLYVTFIQEACVTLVCRFMW